MSKSLQNWDKRTVIWSLAIVVGTVGFTRLVLWPQYRQTSELHNQAAVEKADMQVGQQSPEAVAKLEAEVKQLAIKTANYDASVPHEAALGTILQTLAGFAQKQKLRSENLEPGDPVALDQVQVQPIAMKVRGSFSSVFGLVKDIEHMERLARIERFTTMVDKESPGQVTAELEVRVFFRSS